MTLGLEAEATGTSLPTCSAAWYVPHRTHVFCLFLSRGTRQAQLVGSSFLPPLRDRQHSKLTRAISLSVLLVPGSREGLCPANAGHRSSRWLECVWVGWAEVGENLIHQTSPSRTGGNKGRNKERKKDNDFDDRYEGNEARNYTNSNGHEAVVCCWSLPSLVASCLAIGLSLVYGS